MIQLISEHDSDELEVMMKMTFWSEPSVDILAKTLNSFWTNNGLGVKCLCGDTVVGMAWAIFIDADFCECAMAVLPDYRQKGIGEQLKRELIKQLKGKTKYLLSRVHKKNKASINLNKKLDFKMMGHSLGGDKLLFRLNL